MSSSDRRAVVLSLLALAGCGFEPVYAPGAPGTVLRGRIRFDEPSDGEGFVLVRELERRLGRPASPVYGFSASIGISEASIGVTPQSVITRYQVRGRVDFAVRDLATDKRLTGGSVSSFTSYSTSGSTVSTRAAGTDARERLMVILADRIAARLLATAPDWTR